MKFIVEGVTNSAPADTTLIRLLVRGQKIAKRIFESNCPPIEAIAHEERITASYATRLVRRAFLAPDIVAAILAGKQPGRPHRQQADGRHASAPRLAGSASRAGVRVTQSIPLLSIHGPKALCSSPHVNRRRAQACSATDTPLFPCRVAASLGDVWTERWFPRSKQSETPVSPKVDFETRGLKAAENGREIVSTE